MSIFKLQKPENGKNIDEALDKFNDEADINKYIEGTNLPKYLFWDKVQFKPRPKSFSPEEFWALIKLLRRFSPSRINTVIKDERGTPFSWQSLPGQDYLLHEIDMDLGGALATQIINDEAARQRFITRGIIEEAIASSQLEGANTTRRVAKRMLLERRAPSNKSEQMIINNYTAMRAVEEDYRNQKMSTDLLLELHATITKDTIDKDQIGRFRRDKDEIVVSDPTTNMIYHIPPSQKFLKKEISKFVRYANDESDKQKFVHPVIKAIFLHFWMGYLHPFTDGNGRIARTLFYWYLLKNNYWAFSYLPVSKIIKNAPAQYRDAYIYTEQDDNDLTYFVDYNLRKIKQAKKEFEVYAKRKQAENRKIFESAKMKHHLNDRQIQLLRYLYKNSEATTSINTHSKIYNITRPTARKDLEQLEKIGFLSSEKIGRERPFKGTGAISQLL
ncbi:MAG: Fic family protein [FCB group bacterium]|nr:Fic family protein [FCB group bacterium]